MISDLRPTLEKGIKELGLVLPDKSIDLLLEYLIFLHKWNQTYNITGHHRIEEMLSLHLLDSLAVVKPLQSLILQQFTDLHHNLRILDVGSGAGLPGIVLAICFPDYQFVCLDAVSKKTAFLQQVKARLQLLNVTIVHSRIEAHLARYQIICSRAFSSLKQFTDLTSHCLESQGCWLAMKAKLHSEELNELDENHAVFHVEQLDVPNINADRCLVYLRKM